MSRDGILFKAKFLSHTAYHSLTSMIINVRHALFGVIIIFRVGMLKPNVQDAYSGKKWAELAVLIDFSDTYKSILFVIFSILKI